MDKNILNNKYVLGVLTVFTGMYGPHLRPKLPDYIGKLFDNQLFRILIFFVIVFISSQSLQVALLAAISFTVIMNVINSSKLAEKFIASEGYKNGPPLSNCKVYNKRIPNTEYYPIS